MEVTDTIPGTPVQKTLELSVSWRKHRGEQWKHTPFLPVLLPTLIWKARLIHWSLPPTFFQLLPLRKIAYSCTKSGSTETAVQQLNRSLASEPACLQPSPLLTYFLQQNHQYLAKDSVKVELGTYFVWSLCPPPLFHALTLFGLGQKPY